MKTILYSIVLTATVSVASIFAFQAYESENEYAHLKKDLNETLTWEKRLLNVNSWLFPDTEWEAKRVISSEQIGRANEAHEKAIENTFFSFIALLTGIILIVFIVRLGPGGSGRLAFAVLLVSMTLLAAGVFSPMMEIEVYEDDLAIELETDLLWRQAASGANDFVHGLPIVGDVVGDSAVYKYVFKNLEGTVPNGQKVFKGRMYFYYQNKSAVGVIGELNKQGNYFVLAMLLIFSFIVPFLKLSVSMLLLASPKLAKSLKLRKAIGYIGKLSMGDVFVIAAYLAFLSFYNMNSGIQTSSQTLVGIYFFSGYVLLSIFSYFLVEKHIKLNYHEQIHPTELDPKH